MNIKELNREQLQQVKVNYYMRFHESVSYGEMLDIDSLVSDEAIYNEYDGVSFTEDDFC